MQQLQTVFQVSMVVLICLSAVVFAAAEESPLVSLTVPAAIIAWATIERRHRPGLGPGWSFALGLLGVAASVYEFFTGGIEARILAPSHLLAYLVWIILFQPKADRHYWTLLGLTVLQIAIASLLTTSAWLGVAVILYASCALWTMGVFTLYRAVQSVSADAGGPPGSLSHTPPTRPALVSGRPGLLHDSASTVRHSVHLDRNERMIGWHFTGGAMLMTVLALGLSGTFFLFIPRVWPNQYQLFNDTPLLSARPLTGFSEDVKLGDIGAILENDELVMEVSLFDADSKAAINPKAYLDEFGSEDPLFRGQVMEQYANGRWERANVEDFFGRSRSNWLASRIPPLESNSLRQHIRLQPIGTSILFACGRVLSCTPTEGEERFDLEPTTGTLRRGADGDLSRPIDYNVYVSRLDPVSRGNFPAEYSDHCLALPRGLERLQSLAMQLAPPDRVRSPAERTEILVSYLRDSEDFSYSLDLSVQDPSVDPVIDFLFNRKQGHCEYYASTLALLLRAVGVPSRVVSGFKGGRLNAESGQFEVRQLHAHLWVEAYVGGGWVPLDATPAAREETVAQLQSPPESLVGRLREAWQRTWSQGVRLSRADQDRLLYDPIRGGARDLWNGIRDFRNTGARFGQLLRALGTSPDRWISWRGGVAAFVILLLTSSLYAVAYRIWNLLRRFRGSTEQSRRAAPVVAFYEQFRRAVARAGFERAGSQTPWEFAEDIEGKLGARDVPPANPKLPQFVTDNFYRVRFGNEPLGAELLSELQRQLDQFEQQLELDRKSGASRRAAASSTTG